MRARLFLLALVLTAFVACDEPAPNSLGPPKHEELPTGEWEAPDRYEFNLKSSCGERSLIGRFHIVVEEGLVVDYQGLDEAGKRLENPDFRDSIPTLEELQGEAREALLGTDVLEVEADPTDGHPTRIGIDYNENAIDDEACYVITKYSVVSG